VSNNFWAVDQIRLSIRPLPRHTRLPIPFVGKRRADKLPPGGVLWLHGVGIVCKDLLLELMISGSNMKCSMRMNNLDVTEGCQSNPLSIS